MNKIVIYKVIVMVLGISCFLTPLSAKENFIYPKIPFNIEGINLCEFRAAFSQDRLGYMRELAQLSQELTHFPHRNSERLSGKLIERYNELYEQNMFYAQKGLGSFLEASFKAYIEQYYKELKPRERKLFFKNNLPDIMILGHYSLSPQCHGHVNVNLELIERNAISTSYQASGPAQTVMSKIASQIFEKYQRTQFPTTLFSGGKELTIIGGANRDISTTLNLEEAQLICESLDARLPTLSEYKLMNALGSWSGGISLGDKAWAMNYPNVYLYKPNRSPVTNIQFLATDIKIFYVCLR